MTPKKKPKLRGLAEPYLTREPLFIRFCSAFVDNLAMLLRVALVVGGIFLVQELPVLLQVPPEAADSAESAVANKPAAQPEPAKPDAAIVSEGVQHALYCTFEDYRNEHFDACVEEDSQVYKRPQADPDDTGFIFYNVDTLYASTAGTTPTR